MLPHTHKKIVHHFGCGIFLHPVLGACCVTKTGIKICSFPEYLQKKSMLKLDASSPTLHIVPFSSSSETPLSCIQDAPPSDETPPPMEHNDTYKFGPFGDRSF